MGSKDRVLLRAFEPVCHLIELPAEVQPFLTVSIHAKISGYIEKITVDRGSGVKQGDLLVELSGPEMAAHIAEAEAKVRSMASDRLQAEAQLAAARSTYEATQKAAQTPGLLPGTIWSKCKSKSHPGRP